MTNDTASPSGAPKTVSQMLGEIVWLMTQSPVHKQMYLGDLEWFCMPAILLEQYRVFYGPSAPAAVALWARVSKDVEDRLLAGGAKLRADEWQSGELYWLVELVAPFGATEEIFADLQASVFERKTFKYHRLTSEGIREVAVVNPDLSPILN